MKKDGAALIIIGRRLQNIRKLISLSRREMEQRHGVSANSLKAWEAGNVEIGVFRLISYLKIFEQYKIKISLDNLLQTSENYLDTIHRQSAVNSWENNFSSFSFLSSNKQNEDIELICNLFTHKITSILQEKELILRAIIDNLP